MTNDDNRASALLAWASVPLTLTYALDMSGNPIYGTKRWKELRTQVIQDEPVCHWCRRKPSTQADHVIEVDAGIDPYDRTNIVGSCASCNASRGATYVNRKTAARIQNRNNATNATTKPSEKRKTETPFSFSDKQSTPSPHFQDISKRKPSRTSEIEVDLPEIGRALPRLITPYEAAGDYVASVEAFAERVYGVKLMEWQKVTLAGQLAYATPEDRETGTLIHRSSLTTSARQQGKSVALRILASWWAVQMAAIRGEPQTIMLVANEYQRAADLFMDIAEPMVELFGAKLMKSYQRQSLVFPDGTTIRSAAATAGKVGYSVDLLLIDEIWAISPQVVWGALKPSQVARRSPLFSCWSTAGDTGSEVMISMREGAINSIDKGEKSPMFFAEWSAPSGSPVSDRQFWPWSNPALGTTVSWEALEDAYKTLPSSEFVQQHLNMWQGSTQSWIPNIWHDLVSQVAMPPGGILAVDSSLDDQRYCGVRAVQHDGRVIVTTEFVVESQAQMWAEVNRVMQDRDVQLRVNPTIHPNVPPDFARRTQIVGYREMKTATPMVRSMIIEDKLRHTGENSLAEHVTRAVMVKLSEGAAPLSSQKSPGPIELARCMVWAAAEAGRPVRSSKAAFAFG